MQRFNQVNFLSLTSDGGDLDVFTSKGKNMRYNLAVGETVVLNSSDEHNLPGLAYRLLGDENLWWVLLAFNGLYDALDDVKAGLKLKVPVRRDLIAYLETADAAPSNVII